MRVAAVASLLVRVLAASPAGAAPTHADLEHELDRLAQDKAHAPSLAGTIARGRDALRRAHAMDQANDTRHAALLREAAQDWVLLAGDLVRTTDAEAKAARTEKALAELETKSVRARALLEETVARRDRARAQLEELERKPPAPPPAAGTDQKPPGKPSKTPKSEGPPKARK